MDDNNEMNRHEKHGEDVFFERIIQDMRADEQLDADFEERVMMAVHSQTQDSHIDTDIIRRNNKAGGWWRNSYTIHISPVAGFAIAAGFAFIVLLGNLAIQSHFSREINIESALPVTTVNATTPDTVHILRFVLMAPDAQSVSIVGDFNGWDKTATPLTTAARPGVWTTSIVLPPGRHEYAFIVRDGSQERWVLDPTSGTVHDDFDTESSVVVVPPILTSEHAL